MSLTRQEKESGNGFLILLRDTFPRLLASYFQSLNSHLWLKQFLSLPASTQLLLHSYYCLDDCGQKQPPAPRTPTCHSSARVTSPALLIKFPSEHPQTVLRIENLSKGHKSTRGVRSEEGSPCCPPTQGLLGTRGGHHHPDHRRQDLRAALLLANAAAQPLTPRRARVCPRREMPAGSVCSCKHTGNSVPWTGSGGAQESRHESHGAPRRG